MELPITVRRPILRYDGEKLRETSDEIVTEYALTIQLDERELATMVCTPADLEELVVGFLLSEGIVPDYAGIAELSIDERTGFAYVTLAADVPKFQLDLYNKRYLTSCCGKSRQSFYFYQDVQTANPVSYPGTIDVRDAVRLLKGMQELSEHFRSTGGVHNAALCTVDGILFTRADIGRHNALDKIYGRCLIDGIPTSDKIIAFSGRVSSEVLLKAGKMGVAIVLSKSAPTELALNMAEELGITVIGFIRGSSLNVYTHQERVTGPR